MNTGPLNLTTQDVYRPIDKLSEEREQAHKDLCVAVATGNTEAAKAAFDKIVQIVARQNQAFHNLNQYVLSKVHYERND